MPEPDPRTVRLVELREQLAAILSELRCLEPGSPEQLKALKRYEPVHAAVLALAEELGVRSSRLFAVNLDNLADVGATGGQATRLTLLGQPHLQESDGSAYAPA